jgi:hypothetical protein
VRVIQAVTDRVDTVDDCRTTEADLNCREF